MAKVSFVKMENMLTETLRKMMIDRLSELAAIVTLMQNAELKIQDTVIEQILKRFQTELEKIKKHDTFIYRSLEITDEDERKFSGSFKEFSLEDWKRLKILKEKIDELKKELHGLEPIHNATFDDQVETERLKHKNKRFNIREGWLPLD